MCLLSRASSSQLLTQLLCIRGRLFLTQSPECVEHSILHSLCGRTSPSVLRADFPAILTSERSAWQIKFVERNFFIFHDWITLALKFSCCSPDSTVVFKSGYHMTWTLLLTRQSGEQWLDSWTRRDILVVQQLRVKIEAELSHGTETRRSWQPHGSAMIGSIITGNFIVE